MPAASSLSHLLPLCYHVHIRCPQLHGKCTPNPCQHLSHSQRGFCVLLKSLKHLFPVYRDTCKGTLKETSLQSYQIPKTALSGCGNQSQPLNQPHVCLGRHCFIQYLQLHVPGFWLTVFSFSFSFRYYPKFLSGPLLADSPIALMLLAGFDHLNQLTNWLLFYEFFFPSESRSPD